MSCEVELPKVAKLLKDRFLLRLLCYDIQVKALRHLELLKARAASVQLCVPPHVVCIILSPPLLLLGLASRFDLGN